LDTHEFKAVLQAGQMLGVQNLPSELKIEDFDGLLLAGGHAQGMRQYLENTELQSFIPDFFQSDDPESSHKPAGVICHGVLMAARSKSKVTGLSVLHGRKTTRLTWSQENEAQQLSRFVRFWGLLYYRTYWESKGYRGGWKSKYDARLKDKRDFVVIPSDMPDYKLKINGLARDKPDDNHPA
jgi:putative intracellular protease/amidase